jgi:GT2 family glycosyltransferase
MIDIVSATRKSEADFWDKSALGISLRRLEHDERLTACIRFENRRGLPEVYNARITAPDAGEIITFIHDDVWLDDYFLAERLIEGVRSYDVLGVVGNRRRLPRQPGWAFADLALNWDAIENLTGSVAHGDSAFGQINAFGYVPAECELLDGVFLAAKRDALRNSGVLFDPRFEFHFYDLDFCRSARKNGLRLGTWPICMTHQSLGGSFGSDPWRRMYDQYIEKWGE